MDHQTAIRLQAAEQYVSGELPETERDAFEEHFFECSECAEEVRWEQVFAANARAALRELPRVVSAAIPARRAGAWFSLDWLRPAFAVSAFANLLLLGVVGYEALRVVPRLQSELSQADSPQLSASIAVPTSVRGDSKIITVSPTVGLVTLSFVLPRQFSQYTYSVIAEGSRDGTGHQYGPVPPPEAASEELPVSIPTARLDPGIYRVVLSGVEGSSRVEIGSCRLQVQH